MHDIYMSIGLLVALVLSSNRSPLWLGLTR
jgi:hypothetical protein